MHIGLIGGIGVAATLVYYQRLTAAIAARGGIPDLTIVHADAQTLLDNNRADNRDAQAAIYAALIDRLAAAGAEAVAITSLGGHFCYPEAVAASRLPLISAIAPIDQHFEANGGAPVGLLGTKSAMGTGLYGQLQTESLAPDNFGEIGLTYENMALRGHTKPSDPGVFLDAGQRLIDRGAKTILLAGTDLGLVFDHATPGYPVVDALDLHIAWLADLAVGRLTLDQIAD